MQETTGDLVCITVTPGERKINATYADRKNTLRLYDNRDHYKLSVYRALEEMFSSGTKKRQKYILLGIVWRRDAGIQGQT